MQLTNAADSRRYPSQQKITPEVFFCHPRRQTSRYKIRLQVTRGRPHRRCQTGRLKVIDSRGTRCQFSPVPLCPRNCYWPWDYQRILGLGEDYLDMGFSAASSVHMHAGITATESTLPTQYRKIGTNQPLVSMPIKILKKWLIWKSNGGYWWTSTPMLQLKKISRIYERYSINKSSFFLPWTPQRMY